jgi:hypothetical protein
MNQVPEKLYLGQKYKYFKKHVMNEQKSAYKSYRTNDNEPTFK